MAHNLAENVGGTPIHLAGDDPYTSTQPSAPVRR